MSHPTEGSQGIVGSLRRLLGTLLGIAQNRLELFLLELQEEQGRMVGVLLLAAAAVVFGLMSLIAVSFTVVVVFWEEGRVIALGGLSAFYLIAFGVTLWRLKVRFRDWSAFSATLDELKKDREWLEKNT